VNHREGGLFIQRFLPAMLYGSIFLLAAFLYYKATREPYTLSVKPNKNTGETVSILVKAKSIGTWHLFGSQPMQRGQNQLSNYKLIGIIYKRWGESSAIIAANGKESLYKEGEKLSSEISIVKIEPTKILLNTSQGKLYLELFVEK
jgi:type II secretory pathway component PulC